MDGAGPKGKDELPSDWTWERFAVVVVQPPPISTGLTPLQGGNDNKAKNLEACIGECDNDGQCKSGLKCFQRNDFTPVPGCSGKGKKGWDYCYDPTGSTELQGGDDNKAKNLDACIGECDNDGQCKSGLKCFQRSNGETIPGCTGSGAGKDWDYCYDPSWQPGSTTPAAAPASTGLTPLQGGNDNKAKNLEACIGECDNDGQCKSGLKCFQRNNGETIPG